MDAKRDVGAIKLPLKLSKIALGQRSSSEKKYLQIMKLINQLANWLFTVFLLDILAKVFSGLSISYLACAVHRF